MTLRNVASSGISTKSYNQTNQNNQVGNFILKANAPAQLWSPSWDNTNTTIRPLPALDPADPTKFLPAKVDDPNGGDPVFSNWVRRYWVVRRFGDPGISMIVADDATDPNDVAMACPASVLHRAIKRACDRRQDQQGWSSLVNGQNALITKPKQCCFVQCFLFRWKGRLYIQNERGAGQPPRGARPDDAVVVMMLPSSAYPALFRAMDQGKEPYELDPTSIHPGGFVHIFERGTNPIRSKDAPAQQNVYDGRNDGAEQGNSQFRSYDVKITPTLDGGPNDFPASLRGHEKLVAAKLKPWDDLLVVRSNEEQLQIICRSFLACTDMALRGILISTLRYAFGDSSNAHLLPDEIRDHGRSMSAPSVTRPVAPTGRPGTQPPAPTHNTPVEPVVPNPFDGSSAPQVTANLYGAPVSSGQEEVSPDTVPINSSAPVAGIVSPDANGGVPSSPAVQKAMAEAEARARARQVARSTQPVT